MVTPTASRYLPAPHSRHTLRPVVLEYFPAPQSTQVEMLDATASEEYLPATQLVHAVEPVWINTPARIDIQPGWPNRYQLQTTILMYRASTCTMNISSLFWL